MTKHRKYHEPKPLFIERMKQLITNEKDFNNYISISKEDTPNSIRCNTLKISPSKLKLRLEENYNWTINQPFKDFPEIMIIEGKKIEDNHINTANNSNNQNNLKESINDLPLTTSLRVGGWEYDSKISTRKNLSNIIQLSPGELGRSIEHLLGYYYVQEISSMLPVIALNINSNINQNSNETVLDLCASPGSKTTQIASSMNNQGLIIANEISLGRIKILSANLGRCGVTNTIITLKNGINLCENFYENNILFDKILVDAPCSGEGTLRSSPKTAIMWNINMIKKLSKIQKHLVESALKILKPNGTLIYSTCTHAPEENEEVIDYMLRLFSNKIKIEKASISLPKELKSREGITNWQNNSYSKEIKQCCRIYPQDNNTEGFFIAKIRKLIN